MHSRLTVSCASDADVGPEGRGLVATRRVGGDEALLRIPRSLVLTAEDATQLSPLSASAQRTGLPDWSVLAMFLVDVRLRGGSEWGEYVAMLPAASGCVLEWKQSQVPSSLFRSSLETVVRCAQVMVSCMYFVSLLASTHDTKGASHFH